MATRYISLKEMCKLVGKSHPTLWRMWAKRNESPKPSKTESGIFLGWPEEVYEKWVKDKNP
ncbi:hypothetical protein AFK69_17380 [Xenorhabdus sp. GDc328]|nr:hypothetical protein [Xenorhabdus sp. GDc328]KLU14512.1 hypothetical protein AAY47_15975 [Xenorhabdus griffiniae]KOP32081.1 hypothetical protein AFK69_17380 [Xenorhabdus sp. GDc328]